MNQEAVFSILQGSILAIIFITIAYLLGYLLKTWSNFQDEQDSQEETEANAMTCPPECCKCSKKEG